MSETMTVVMRPWAPGLCLEGGRPARPLDKGDYVLATKYDDGDPLDGYAIGFFDSYLGKGSGYRYMIVDSAGRQYRGNGFRRAERISYEMGDWLVANRAAFEALSRISPINLWRFKYRGAAERAALEGWAMDEGREAVEEHRKRWFA
jgi:hypothetical protein